MAHRNPESTRCTALRSHGAFCDLESLPDAPFPICIKHASKLLRYLNSYMPAPDDFAGRTVLIGRAFEQNARRPIERVSADETKLPPMPALVYYLRVGALLKIGFTTNLLQRMDSYPPDSKLLAVEPGDFKLEAARHRQFAHLRAEAREWFTPDDELMAHIARIARRYDIRDYYQSRQRKSSIALDPDGRQIA